VAGYRVVAAGEIRDLLGELRATAPGEDGEDAAVPASLGSAGRPEGEWA